MLHLPIKAHMLTKVCLYNLCPGGGFKLGSADLLKWHTYCSTVLSPMATQNYITSLMILSSRSTVQQLGPRPAQRRHSWWRLRQRGLHGPTRQRSQPVERRGLQLQASGCLRRSSPAQHQLCEEPEPQHQHPVNWQPQQQQQQLHHCHNSPDFQENFHRFNLTLF